MLKTIAAILCAGSFVALAFAGSAAACGYNQSAMSKPVVTASGKTPAQAPSTSQTPQKGG